MERCQELILNCRFHCLLRHSNWPKPLMYMPALPKANSPNTWVPSSLPFRRIEGGQMPRAELLSRVVAFIEETRQSSMEIQDDIVSTIAHSNEFRALIARIAGEL